MIEFKRINKYCVLERHFNELGQLHREDGPAKIYWYYVNDDLENCQTGEINKKEYFLNGKHFNKADGPIIIKYSNGNVSYKEFSNNEKGLKSITYKYIKNKLVYKKEEYHNDSLIIIQPSVNNTYTKRYFNKSRMHRIDGPAMIRYFDNGNIKEEHYYKNGKLHNLFGPAVVDYYENGEIEKESYCIDGKLYNELEYYVIIGNLK